METVIIIQNSNFEFKEKTEDQIKRINKKNLVKLHHLENEDHNIVKEHDYCIRKSIIIRSNDYEFAKNLKQTSTMRKFAKCETCRKSRTKVLLPKSVLHLTKSKNDGKTCDFCGAVMKSTMPSDILPNRFEGRRGSRDVYFVHK